MARRAPPPPPAPPRRPVAFAIGIKPVRGSSSRGVKVTEQEMQAINITRDEFHGEWNYTISPNQQPP